MRYGQVSERVVLFDGMYVADPLAVVLKLAAFLFVAVALLYSRAYLENRNILRGEYYVLALTALLGIFVLISANSLLTVYLGVELLALSVYAMVAFDRDSGVRAEAAMKYFVLGAIASGALLYGMSLIYGLTGTLDLGTLAARLHAPLSAGAVAGADLHRGGGAFKLGAVPFHMWLPDVYEGAPTSVTLFIGTAPKIAYFALALRLLAQGLAGSEHEWSQMLTALAVLTLVIGNVVALVQTNLKRMLAYSTIANVGFIVLGFVAGTPDGYAAAMYYTLVYVLVALGSFGVILLASSRGFEADRLDDYKGLYRRDPLLALVMMVLMFSTAGVPPFVGFWAKLRIFQVAVGERPPVAGGAGRRHVGGRRLLLPARHQAHVLRRAGRGAAARAPRAAGAPGARAQRRRGAGARAAARAAARPVRTGHPLRPPPQRRSARSRGARRWLAAGAAVLLAATLAQARPQYRLTREVPLPGDEGWDYLTFEQGGHRLFVAHGTRVLVIDTDHMQVVGEIADTPGVHGIALAPALGRGFISAGRSSTIVVFDLKTLARLSEIHSSGEGPDAIYYDRATQRVFAFNGRSHDVTAIDAASGTLAGTIALAGKPESAAGDGEGRLYVNLEDRGSIAALDARSLAVTAVWPVAGCEDPSGLALDARGRRLFAACGNGVMAVLDAHSGRLLGSAPIGSGVDFAAYDPGARLAFASCGEGVLTAVTVTAAGTVQVAQSVPTRPGARTMALDERTHRIFLVTANFGPPPAATPEQPHPRAPALPGSFRLLVVEPYARAMTQVPEGRRP